MIRCAYRLIFYKFGVRMCFIAGRFYYITHCTSIIGHCIVSRWLWLNWRIFVVIEVIISFVVSLILCYLLISIRVVINICRFWLVFFWWLDTDWLLIFVISVWIWMFPMTVLLFPIWKCWTIRRISQTIKFTIMTQTNSLFNFSHAMFIIISLMIIIVDTHIIVGMARIWARIIWVLGEVIRIIFVYIADIWMV